MKIRLAIILAGMVLIGGTLAAQAQIGKFGIGIHGTASPAATGEEEEKDREFTFGGHIRARLTNNFALEASVDYRKEETELYSLTLYPVQFSALYYLLPSSRVGIYGLFGFGFTRSTLEGDFFDEEAEDTAMSYHWGGGIEIPLTEGFTLYGDARWLDIDLDFGDIIDLDVASSGWQWGGGVTIYF